MIVLGRRGVVERTADLEGIPVGMARTPNQSRLGAPPLFAHLGGVLLHGVGFRKGCHRREILSFVENVGSRQQTGIGIEELIGSRFLIRRLHGGGCLGIQAELRYEITQFHQVRFIEIILQENVFQAYLAVAETDVDFSLPFSVTGFYAEAYIGDGYSVDEFLVAGLIGNIAVSAHIDSAVHKDASRRLDGEFRFGRVLGGH